MNKRAAATRNQKTTPGHAPWMPSVGRPLGDWAALAGATPAPNRGRVSATCDVAGCERPTAVALGGFGFCREHWPAARRWWLGDDHDADPGLDLHVLYGRREARAYSNEQLAARGQRPVTEGGFLRLLYPALYPDSFGLEPLRLGRRVGMATAGDYALIVAFTRRMLDEVVARRAAGDPEPVRPTPQECAAFLGAGEAAAFLTERRPASSPVTSDHLVYWRATGRLPAVRVGPADVFLRSDIERLARLVGMGQGESDGNQTV